MSRKVLVLLICMTLVGCTFTLDKSLAELTNSQLPESISMHDEWVGLSPIAPRIIDYILVREGENFTGPINFSVGGYFGDSSTASENVSIPVTTIQQFLKKLGEAGLETGKYAPLIQRTDDYPTITLGIHYPSKTFEFFTASQGDKFVPWKLTIQPGKEYVINSGTPADALELLRPYLHYDVLTELIKKAEAEQK